MKIIKKIKIGSAYFFDEYEDFLSKDTDYICIMDSFPFERNIMNVKLKGDDVFLCRNTDKHGFIEDLVSSGVNMKAGKFLVPEFNKYINFTIDDLKSILYIFDNIDDKHAYEKIIAEAYIENNDFILTNEQINLAYEDYKRARS